MSNVTVPSIADAYNPEIGVETYLRSAHSAFDTLVGMLESSKNESKAEATKVRRELANTLTDEDMATVHAALNACDRDLEDIANDSPIRTLAIVEQLEDMLSYWRKFANFVVDTETSQRNRSVVSNVDTESVKAQAVQLRTELDSVLIYCSATGVEIPDSIPTKDKNGVITYGGELPRGAGTGSNTGPAAKVSRLEITKDGEPIETYSRRKIQEIIFRHINPTMGLRLGGTKDLEEYLEIDSIFQDSGWELGPFKCEKVSE